MGHLGSILAYFLYDQINFCLYVNMNMLQRCIDSKLNLAVNYSVVYTHVKVPFCSKNQNFLKEKGISPKS